MFREHVIECRQRRPGPGASRGVSTASPDLSVNRNGASASRTATAKPLDERRGIHCITPAMTASITAPRVHGSDAPTRTFTIFSCIMITRRIQPYATGARSVLTPQITLPQRLSVRYTRYRDYDCPPPTPP